MIKALAIISNGVSASMLEAAAAHDGIDFAEIAVIGGRRIQHGWKNQCAEYIELENAPSLRPLGQLNTLGFYARALRVLKKALLSPDLTDIYIANSDNLLSNHALRWAEQNHKVRVTVVAEGFMNYQDIGVANRFGWRWAVKPAMAFAMGLRYTKPRSHLSGSFEARVDRVVSFSAFGLKAPDAKTTILQFPSIGSNCQPKPGKILIVLTGLAQWMETEEFDTFKQAFGDWVRSLGAKEILVKRHPNYPSGGIENEVGDFVFLDDSRGLEMMAGDIDAAQVIGFCTTALVTLKLIRPDLRCIDFGSNFYCEKAYHGDRSIINVLKNGSVEIVNFDH